jgi:hypothetical protein
MMSGHFARLLRISTPKLGAGWMGYSPMTEAARLCHGCKPIRDVLGSSFRPRQFAAVRAAKQKPEV